MVQLYVVVHVRCDCVKGLRSSCGVSALRTTWWLEVVTSSRMRWSSNVTCDQVSCRLTIPVLLVTTYAICGMSPYAGEPIWDNVCFVNIKQWIIRIITVINTKKRGESSVDAAGVVVIIMELLSETFSVELSWGEPVADLPRLKHGNDMMTLK